MDIWKVLLDVVVLLGSGALLGSLLERLGQSAIIGYLLAGAVLGPNALHLVESAHEVLAVSELGVALLLFVIGLEFSWPRMRAMGPGALGAGALQVVLTLALGALVASLAGFGLAASLTLGSLAALSSTACVLRVLTARGQVDSPHGERALGILLVQDVFVVPLVLLVSVLAEGGTAGAMLLRVGRTSAVGVGLVAVLYVTFHFLVPRLLRTPSIRANRELPLLVAVVSGLGSGVLAHAVGVSPALGAFVAGLLLAESPFAVQVRAEVSSLKTLLLTLFFSAVGMLVDPGWIAEHALLFALTVLGVLVGKASLVWGVLRALRTPGPTALAAGIGLAQVGEFSFVLADVARGSLLSEEVFTGVASLVVVSMILTPPLVRYAPALAGRICARRAPHEAREHAPVPEADTVVVVGFGPAGRVASERIAASGARVSVVDQNPDAVREASALGYHAVTGDARYPHVLDHALLERATCVVVTVPTTGTAVEIVRYVRQGRADLRVLARARFHRHVPDLVAAGAEVVVDEEHEVGLRVASAFEERML